MAYIHDIAVTTQASTTAATYAMNMPDHAIGDLLVWYASADAGTLTPSGSTWTIIGTNPTSTTTNIIVTAAGYRLATTATETLSLATSDVASCIVVCFKEVDATTPFDGVTIDFTAVNTATSTPVSVTKTSTTADAMYVSMIAQAGANPMAVSGPGAMFAAISDAGGTTDTLSAHNAVAWKYQRTAGAIPVINWVSNLSNNYTRLSFVLRSAAGGRIPPYIDGAVVTPAELVHLGSYSTTLNGVSHTTNGMTATISGKTATPTTAALLVDSGVEPYTSILTSSAAQTAVGALVGPEITITTAKNTTGKLLAGASMAGNWKQARFGVGSIKQGGVILRIGSGTAPTTAWNAYQVSAKDAAVPPATPAVFVVEPGYAGTAYATGAGGNCSATALKFVQLLRNAPSFSSQVGLTECWLIDKQVIAGGTASFPVDLDGMIEAGASFRLPLVQKAGSSSVVCFAPIQIGGGDAVYYNVDGGVIQFPDRASASKKDLQYHANNNKLGLYLAGKTGDTIKLTNSVVTSPIPQIFEITSGATAAASWDFTGTTIKGLTVTTRPVTTFTTMTFSGCTFTALNVSTFSDTVFTACGTITGDGSTFSSCNITKSTGTTGAYVITVANSTDLDTALAKLSSSQLTGNVTPAGALYINYTGAASTFSVNLDNVKLSGNTKDIYWNATNAGTNVTFNLVNGSTASTSTAVNGTVTFNNPKTFVVTNIVDGSEVRIYKQSDLTELGGAENIGASPSGLSNVTSAVDSDNAGRYTMTYAYNYTVDIPIFVVVLHNNYQALRPSSTLKSTDGSLQISQISDRQYANPA